MQPLTTVTPALTTTVQSTLVTGVLPREHGIVANGWYFRDLSEIWLWRQSDRLVQGEKVWETAKRRDPGFTCAKLFWWYGTGAAGLGVVAVAAFALALAPQRVVSRT